MNAHSILLFGAGGYVGGVVAAFAQASGRRHVTKITSRDFPFWEDADTWPREMLATSADTAILAANFERRIVHDGESALPTLREKFATLIGCLRARRIIFLSTDAVFDGLRGPYRESDPTSPLTIYGRCKETMESVAAMYTEVHTVRMSVVWGAGCTKPDARSARYLKHTAEPLKGATNAFRSPIEVSCLARAIVRMLHEESLPKTLHLATPRMSYYEFFNTCLFPDLANPIEPWMDPAFDAHDTSLITEHAELVRHLLK